jgi:hypothetical protein
MGLIVVAVYQWRLPSSSKVIDTQLSCRLLLNHLRKSSVVLQIPRVRRCGWP